MARSMRRRSVALLLPAVLAVCVLAPAGAGASTRSSSAYRSAATGDDYPANLRRAYITSMVDPWRFYNRGCTSFVAWRLNHNNHIPFTNAYGGTWWGNASGWASAARSIGLAVDHHPSLGAVAWDAYPMHVAWVSKVNHDGTINIEEYNYNPPGSYHQRLHVAPSTFDAYIHVADLVASSASAQAASLKVLREERALDRQRHPLANAGLRLHAKVAPSR